MKINGTNFANHKSERLSCENKRVSLTRLLNEMG